jgi:hypothetical protein
LVELDAQLLALLARLVQSALLQPACCGITLSASAISSRRFWSRRARRSLRWRLTSCMTARCWNSKDRGALLARCLVMLRSTSSATFFSWRIRRVSSDLLERGLGLLRLGGERVALLLVQRQVDLAHVLGAGRHVGLALLLGHLDLLALVQLRHLQLVQLLAVLERRAR